MTRTELDKQTCNSPDCKGDCSNHILFIHSRCHSEAPLMLERCECGMLEVLCCICSSSIAQLGSNLVLPEDEEFPADEVYFHQSCHEVSPIWVSYTHNSGVLEITCAYCSKTVGEVILDE